MPSATRAEALVGIVEVIDGIKPIDLSEQPIHATGPAIKARRETQPQFPPLGPLDMLYIRKRYVPVVGAPKQYGYYHTVRGVASSSVAKISAYIVDVVCNNGLDPQSWVSTGAWEIVSATFLAYNIMAEADLVVHVDFPGSTIADAFDRNGNPFPITDLFWHQLHVSSQIRDFCRHGEQPSYPCLRVISSTSWSHAEKAFLEAASKCVHDWHLSGSPSTNDQNISAAKSRIAIAIRDHFIDFARYEAALQFFSMRRVVDLDPQCALHAATAARLMGNLDHAVSIVDGVIEKCPKSDIGWMERAKIHRARGDLYEAMHAANTAGSFAGDDVLFWASVADLHVDLRQYAHALNALNSADMPPPTLDHYLRVLLRDRNNETCPIEGNANGTDSARVFAKRLREEKNYTNDKTDDLLSDLPAKLMANVDHACYSVLAKVLNDLTWDRMLAVRGQCFVMETDIENGQANDADSQPDESIGDDENSEETVDPITNGMTNISLDGSDNPLGSNEDSNESAEKNNVVSAKARKLSLEKSGKKVCKPWLDYLVTNMYNDLRAMALWHAEEQQHAAAASLAATAAKRLHSGASDTSGSEGPSNRIEEDKDMEAQDVDEPVKRTSEEIAKTTHRPSADWLRRGELALRLSKHEDAQSAFLVCLKIAEKEKKIAVTALSRLMTMASNDGDARSAIRYADTIWSFMDANTDRKPSSDPSPATTDVRKAIFKLVSTKGLSAVREIATDGGLDVDKKRFEGLLLDAVALRVDGFSR